MVENLAKYPVLLRLTLRSNDVVSLRGIEQARCLRWLDASTNGARSHAACALAPPCGRCMRTTQSPHRPTADLRDVAGLSHMYALEWLDLHDNDLRSLAGLGWCPNVSFLNLHQCVPRLRARASQARP